MYSIIKIWFIEKYYQWFPKKQENIIVDEFQKLSESCNSLSLAIIKLKNVFNDLVEPIVILVDFPLSFCVFIPYKMDLIVGLDFSWFFNSIYSKYKY